MKIGIVIRRMRARGAADRRTSELIKGLLAAGHEVHLFAEKWDKNLELPLHYHKLHTIKLARWLKVLSFAVSAAHETKKWNLDITHNCQAHTYSDDVTTLGGGCHADYLDHFLAGMPPARQAWERMQLFNRVTLAIEKAQYRNCARILPNSNFGKAGLLRYYPEVEAKCRVIHNGVDGDFFKPDTGARERLRQELGLQEAVVYLFVGSGFERKGLKEFLQALALTQKQNPGRRLVGLAVGHGDFPVYRELAKELGIGEQVIFTGRVDEPRSYYCAADVFVLPSRYDPCAHSVNEALATELPVITTRTNGSSERVTDEVGYVVNHAGEVEAIAAAMGELLDDDRRREMGQKAREVALQNPWSEVTRRVIGVYEEILAERAKK